jgi:broad specificity phosphatase PhoE
MIEFLFFRHGETDWNKSNLFQGHTDIPLNETGQLQAQLMGQKIQHWNPDVVLSSDLVRAQRTGAAANQHWDAPVVLSPALREMFLGKAEGLHRDEVMKLVGPDWVKWISPTPADENFGFPGGETKAETRARVLSFLQDYVKKNPQHRRIAVSTHGGVLRRITHGLSGIPEGGVPIPNCVTYRLDLTEQGWQFVPDRHRASSVVIHENKILTFKAVDPFNQSHYHFVPGGVLEANEKHEECAVRETYEETGYDIDIHANKKVSVEYDFVWNGQKRWCRTEFLRGELRGEYFEPRPIKDASYHRGVEWKPISEKELIFNYSSAIKHAIHRVTGT